MPPVLVPLFTAAGLTGSLTIGTATISTAAVAAYAVTTAATLGASFLLSQMNQQGNRNAPQQTTIKQSLPIRRRTVGRDKVAGVYVFAETDAGGNLWHGYYHCEGPIDAVEENWLNDNAGGANITTGWAGLPWGSNIAAWTYLGATTQTASAELTSYFPVGWTSDHRLRGLCYSVVLFSAVREKVFSVVYPSGLPQLRLVIRGQLMRDPRDASTAWTENAGIVVMDELINAKRMKLPLSLIDEDGFADFADRCDEAVALHAGGTEPRYQVGYTHDLSEPPRASLRRAMQACDAELYPTPDGTINIRGGAWEEPTVTLTRADITMVDYVRGNDKLAACNYLAVTFTNPAADYQPAELDPIEDTVSQAQIGELRAELSLPQVRSWTQARRLQKIHWYKTNPEHRLSIRTGPSGLRAYGERMVHVTLPSYGIDDDFLITKLAIAGDAEYCDIDLISLPAEAYEWDEATEEGTAPTAPASVAVALAPPEPTGLALESEGTEITAGVYSIRLRGTVDDVTGTSWLTIGRYRKTGDSIWLNADPDPDDQWSFLTPPIEDGAEYELQAAHSGSGGHVSSSISDWTDTETITATADATAPDAPSLFSVGGTGSTAALQWYTGGSANFYGTRVYRGATTTFGAASVIETLYSSANVSIAWDNIGLASGTYYYWVTAINRSGVESSPTGPQSRTVP